MLYGPALPVTRPPTSIGTSPPVVQPDAAAEEHHRHVARIGLPTLPPPPRGGSHAAEREDALALEKEVALLRKEHAEAVRFTCCSSSSTCAKSVL